MSGYERGDRFIVKGVIILLVFPVLVSVIHILLFPLLLALSPIVWHLV